MTGRIKSAARSERKACAAADMSDNAGMVGAIGKAGAAGKERMRSPRRPWGDTPTCDYCGAPSATVDESGVPLCASCAERVRLLRVIRATLKRRKSVERVISWKGDGCL